MTHTPKYINPLTDFGFKRLFGTEANKDLLIDFLNSVLMLESEIKDLEYRNNEQIGNTEEDRKAFFDLFCTNMKGEEFVIEMQKAKLTHFRDRSLFYVTFPIQNMAKKNEWNFELRPIFYITIMDFYYEPQETAKLLRKVMLKDEDNEIFYNKLLFIYIQLKAFDKSEAELTTRQEKWFYFLKNLENIPENIKQLFLKDEIFNKMIKLAEIAKLSPDEYQNYEISRMQYLELKGIRDTAIIDAEQAAEEKYQEIIVATEAREKEERRLKEEERRQKEKAKALLKTTVFNLKSKGFTDKEIAATLGLDLEKLNEFLG